MVETAMSDVLCLTDAYASSHSTGDEFIKSCIWNICLARRVKGGFHMGRGNSFSALDVREELRARAILECRDPTVEPCLVVDDDDDDETEKNHKGENYDEDLYILHMDGLKSKKEEYNNSRMIKDSNKTSSSSNTNDVGLRQRKNKVPSKEQQVWEEDNHDESEMLEKADPIELFGMLSPPALKVAQTKSREALASYIEAANLAAAIMRFTGATDEKTTLPN